MQKRHRPAKTLLLLAFSSLIFLFLSAARGNNNFEALEESYEAEQFAQCLSSLEFFEKENGASPRIESMRALSLHKLGRKRDAYLSLLNYFQLTAGLDLTDNEAHASLVELRDQLQQRLLEEERLKKEELEEDRMAKAEALIQSVAANSNNKMQQVVTASNGRFVAMSKATADPQQFQSELRSVLNESSGAEKEALGEIVQVIEDKGEFERLVAEADAAMEGGLMAKAADLYRKAYLSFPKRGAVGLKAASIYVERLDRLFDAAVLWRRIEGKGDPASASAARVKLLQHHGDLEILYNARLAQAENSQKQGDPTPLLLLAEAFPDKVDLHLKIASLFAEKLDVANTVQSLATANKIGLRPKTLFAYKEFAPLLTNEKTAAPFKQFLSDAFGTDFPAELLADSEKVAEERRVKEEQARKIAEKHRLEQERILSEQKKKEEELRSPAFIAKERNKTLASINEVLAKIEILSCASQGFVGTPMHLRILTWQSAVVEYDQANKTYRLITKTEHRSKSRESEDRIVTKHFTEQWPTTGLQEISAISGKKYYENDECYHCYSYLILRVTPCSLTWYNSVLRQNIKTREESTSDKESSGNGTVEELGIPFSGENSDFKALRDAFLYLKEIDSRITEEKNRRNDQTTRTGEPSLLDKLRIEREAKEARQAKTTVVARDEAPLTEQKQPANPKDAPIAEGKSVSPELRFFSNIVIGSDFAELKSRLNGLGLLSRGITERPLENPVQTDFVAALPKQFPEGSEPFSAMDSARLDSLLRSGLYSVRERNGKVESYTSIVYRRLGPERSHAEEDEGVTKVKTILRDRFGVDPDVKDQEGHLAYLWQEGNRSVKLRYFYNPAQTRSSGVALFLEVARAEAGARTGSGADGEGNAVHQTAPQKQEQPANPKEPSQTDLFIGEWLPEKNPEIGSLKISKEPTGAWKVHFLMGYEDWDILNENIKLENNTLFRSYTQVANKKMQFIKKGEAISVQEEWAIDANNSSRLHQKMVGVADFYYKRR